MAPTLPTMPARTRPPSRAPPPTTRSRDPPRRTRHLAVVLDSLDAGDLHGATELAARQIGLERTFDLDDVTDAQICPRGVTDLWIHALHLKGHGRRILGLLERRHGAWAYAERNADRQAIGLLSARRKLKRAVRFFAAHEDRCLEIPRCHHPLAVLFEAAYVVDSLSGSGRVGARDDRNRTRDQASDAIYPLHGP